MQQACSELNATVCVGEYAHGIYHYPDTEGSTLSSMDALDPPRSVCVHARRKRQVRDMYERAADVRVVLSLTMTSWRD